MVSWQELSKDINPKDMIDYGEFRETIHKDGILGGFVVSKQTGKAYAIQVQMDTLELQAASKVKVFCNCDDFKFRWAYVLHKFDGLIAPQNFILLPPKITNPNMVVGCCKHIKVFLEKAHDHSLARLNMVKGQI